MYVIYYGVCFVCGTMVTTVHVHTCVLLSHLCTTVNYCTHLCTTCTVHTCVQLYTVQYTLVYTRTCILYKCPNVVARHLWSAHVSVLRGRPVCTSGEPGFGREPPPPPQPPAAEPHAGLPCHLSPHLLLPPPLLLLLWRLRQLLGHRCSPQHLDACARVRSSSACSERYLYTSTRV